MMLAQYLSAECLTLFLCCRGNYSVTLTLFFHNYKHNADFQTQCSLSGFITYKPGIYFLFFSLLLCQTWVLSQMLSFFKALATSQWNMIPPFSYWLMIQVVKKLFAGVNLCLGRDSSPQLETKHKHIQDLYTG